MDKTIYNAIWNLRNTQTTASLSYIDTDGFPVTRAMLILERDKIGTQYFSTNTSSGKVSALRKNPKASVYYCDSDNFHGALFRGTVEVCTDAQTKRFLWRDGFEKYYPLGIDDPDYCVLKMTVLNGSYYHGLCNTRFSPDVLDG